MDSKFLGKETNPSFSQTSSSPLESEFTPGLEVIYGLHGRCRVIGIQTQTISNQAIPFYKLEKRISASQRSPRNEPAIWVPVETAVERGLRLPLDRAGAEHIIQVLSNREYFFPLQEQWTSIQPKLETCARLEGALGLAKVESYLYVRRKKLIVPPAELIKYHDMIHRLLFKELSDALDQPIKSLEEQSIKWMRPKLTLDH